LIGLSDGPPIRPRRNAVGPPAAPSFDGNRLEFALELAPGRRARVYVDFPERHELPTLSYGNRIEAVARLRVPRGFRNPGSFDFAGYLARHRIWWIASIRSPEKLRILDGGCGSRFLAAVYQVRAAILRRIDRLYPGDDYASAMLRGILLGDDARVERVWTEQYRRTGTYHALVISGLHVTVLGGILLFLLRVLAAGAVFSLLTTACFAWVYALMAGWTPPVVRAAAGLTLFLLARYLFRKGRILNLLAAVAIVFLLIDPGQLFDASFQLSFLAVAAIGALAVPWIEATSQPFSSALRRLADRGGDLRIAPKLAQFRVEMRLLAEAAFLATRLPQSWWRAAIGLAGRTALWAHDMIVVSAVVQLALVLPMAVYFHRVSFSGLTANLLAVPLLNAVVPIGFLAAATGWALPARLARGLLLESQSIVDWHARREPDWRVPDPPLWLACLFAAALVAVALSGRTSRWLRAALAGALAATLVLVVWHPFAPQVMPGEFELTAIDVGQGDSLLVALPGGKLMLFDGGGIPSFGRARRSRIDTGEDVVSPYLWSRSIRRLDVIAATHAHQDHIGGLPALLANFRPAELWVGAAGDGAAWTKLRHAAASLGVHIRTMRQGERFTDSGVEVRVLAPPPDYRPAATPRNNDSLALRIVFGRRSFLLTGDIERYIESRMVAEGLLEKTDVLKVAHHGSRTSTSAPFLSVLRPAFAVISDGFENPYGFPHAEVLAGLSRHRAMVLRTGLDGLVTVRSDGTRITTETLRPRGGGD